VRALKAEPWDDSVPNGTECKRLREKITSRKGIDVILFKTAEQPMPSLRFLFLEVFKLGATAYGGPAMIGQIKETAVNRHAWVKEAEFMRGLALCHLIPGSAFLMSSLRVDLFPS